MGEYVRISDNLHGILKRQASTSVKACWRPVIMWHLCEMAVTRSGAENADRLEFDERIGLMASIFIGGSVGGLDPPYDHRL